MYKQENITITELSLGLRVSGHQTIDCAALLIPKEGMLEALIASFLHNVFPGVGSVIIQQAVSVMHPPTGNETFTIAATVKAIDPLKKIVTLDIEVSDGVSKAVAQGEVVVIAPTEKMVVSSVPKSRDPYHNYGIHDVLSMPPLRTAVVHPVTALTLQSVYDAAQQGLILPVLVGAKDRIIQAAKDLKLTIDDWEIIDAEHSHAAALKAVELARWGHVDALMKGSLKTNELLSAVVSKTSGLSTERRISHAYVMDVPTYHKPLIITDAAINITPSLGHKRDICQNAIDLWRVITDSPQCPKVAILAAAEVVNENIQASIDEACLCKMVDRGQITGGVLDGPLAFDLAINHQAAKEKGLVSLVAGDADILLAPDIHSGNMIAKQLTFLANAHAAGIVLGARVPVILTSRSDSLESRLISCALAAKVAASRRDGKIK
jgi:phosphate acetyltransferase